jgi:hypothetical protein
MAFILIDLRQSGLRLLKRRQAPGAPLSALLASEDLGCRPSVPVANPSMRGNFRARIHVGTD